MVVIALTLVDMAGAGSWTDLAPLLILAVVAERMTVETYSASEEQISLSFGIAVAMAAAAALPHGAALVAIPIALTTGLVRRNRRLEKTLFNLANYALATTVSALVYSPRPLAWRRAGIAHDSPRRSWRWWDFTS